MGKKLLVSMAYLALAELPQCPSWEWGNGISPGPEGQDSHSSCLQFNNISNINASQVVLFF